MLGEIYSPTDTGISDIGSLRTFDSKYILGLYLYTGEMLLNRRIIKEGSEESIKAIFYDEKAMKTKD